MNRVHRLICSLLLACLVACSTTQNIVQSGAIQSGMTKEQLRNALLMTYPDEDPFLDGAFLQFFPDLRLEILGTPARSFFFVFSYVNFPRQAGSYGDGSLSGGFPTYEQALAYVNSHRTVQPTNANPAAEPQKEVQPRPSPTTARVQKEIASGSGFAVSLSGHLVTNNHVIEGCEQVQIHSEGRTLEARVVTKDEVNDLALLQADVMPRAVFSVSDDNPKLLSEIYVAGYPYGNSLSSSIKVTKGIVSSLVGLGNNSSIFQIDAAIQPGNSGGPIVDTNGNVIGVAVSSLDQMATLERFGVIPQNTNFGIKSNVVTNLLASNNVKSRSPNLSAVDSAELGRMMTNATFYISCLGYE